MNEPLWSAPDGAAVLYQEDCRALLPRLPENSVDQLWTDPPYHLSNDGGSCSAGRRVSVNKGAWDRSQGLAADLEFNREWLATGFRALKPGGRIHVTATLHNNPLVAWSLQAVGFRQLQALIWEKANPPPNLGARCFTHSTEIVWAARKPPAEGPTPPLFGPEEPEIRLFPAAGAAEKRLGRHPTQKPLALVRDCLTRSSPSGGLVLDPFAGSGTTGLAALELGMRFVGIEADPEHAALAVRRLRQAAGSRQHTLL